MKETRLRANTKFKESDGYIKAKIRLNCKKHKIDVPPLEEKTRDELHRILFNIKFDNFKNRHTPHL